MEDDSRGTKKTKCCKLGQRSELPVLAKEVVQAIALMVLLRSFPVISRQQPESLERRVVLLDGFHERSEVLGLVEGVFRVA